MKKGILVGIVLLTALAGGVYLFSRPDEKQIYADVSHVLSVDDRASGFERAFHSIPFRFPADLGAHYRFQTEWWYFTGNLEDVGGRPFGYQLTFFRRALRSEPTKGESRWRTNQVYMGHFAVSDIQSDKFLSFERFSRGNPGLAGAVGEPFRVWLENWEVREISPDNWQLTAGTEQLQLCLKLRPQKGMVLNGEAGLSRKGNKPGSASYYYSNTRIKTRGTLRMEGETFILSGSSWLDREWSTSVLSRDQIGWDWFAIQLDDNREIMLFQIRERQGGISDFSSGSYIDATGISTHLNNHEFSILVLEQWRSPATGKQYPAAWQIRIPSRKLNLTVRPRMADQEHHHSFSYWEGAISIDGGDVSGTGYAELTGYNSQ